MKKIIFIVLTILFAVLVTFTMIKGIKIGNVQIYSIQQIKEKNNLLKQKSTEAQNLNLTKYKSTMQTLEETQKELESYKKDYLDVASTSTDEEIKEACQTQVYSMEFLWSEIGNLATEYGIKLTMDVTESSGDLKNTLNFTANGYYQNISDFVYSLEKNKNLGFRIQNFKLTSSSGETLQATFVVYNVQIKKESVTSSVSFEDSTKTDNSNINTKENN